MADIKSAAEASEMVFKKRGGKNKLFLIISGGVLLVALVVSAILLLGAGSGEDGAERVVQFGTVMKGVTVGGIDISGMTRDEALAATGDLSAQLLSEVNFDIDINGEIKTFSSQDFALYTDYETVIEQAIAYGRTGSFDERLKAATDAKEAGIDFPVDVILDEAKLQAALVALKAEMDTPAIDATATFAPWGYTETTAADGTVTYTPVTFDTARLVDMCSIVSKNKEYTDMETRVLIPDVDMPNTLRYEYWNDRKSGKGEAEKGGYGNEKGGYEEENVPRDWNVSRFIYTEEVTGLVVDIDAIAAAVKTQVESDTYETIVAPVQVTPAAVTLEQVKSQTQLISSWSSSYGGSGHKGDYNRNYNVAMMASLLNGSVVEPGQTWSVNERAGKRSTSSPYRWKEAAGIENGAYTPQPGGGVCQLGSTTYNAAIRSGLVAVEHHHHSIPSGYIPLGLDATINSTSLDLKLRNDSTTAVYMVAYVNPSEQNVTVEFYGVPLTDATGQGIIYTFTNKYIGKFGTPAPKTVAKPLGYVCNDDAGTVLTVANTPFTWAESRQGTKVEAYRITKTLDGTQIGNKELFEPHSYPVINGTIYVIDPATLPTPTLPPVISTEPSTDPSTSVPAEG